MLEGRSLSDELTPPALAKGDSEGNLTSWFPSNSFSSFSFSSSIRSFALLMLPNEEGDEICRSGNRLVLSSSSRNLLAVVKDNCLSVVERRRVGLLGVSKQGEEND